MSEYMIKYVDAHVGGESLRLILKGPQLKGSTLMEKREFMMKNYDHIRTAVVLEPRGHDDMYGAVLVDPCHPDADLGVIFIDSAFYNNMCGHGSMAIATIAIELGLVPAKEPVTEVVLETGAGLVTVKVEVENGKTGDATLQGVPSFLYKENLEIGLVDVKVKVDIGFGGNFFVIVGMDQLNLKHSKEYLSDFIRYGLAIREEINSKISIAHPEKPHINSAEDILFVKEPEFPGDTNKSLVVLGHAMVDRSPCGTGTCARMAMLHAQGKLKEDTPFYHESITGALFEGRINSLTKVADLPAVLPRVKGKAYLTGMGTLLINSADPLKYGFSLR
ncbi:MAG: proline racemase family protein [Dethiobacteria bacterium]